jgi:diguanylate cyclase (GGDEF)-like protein
MTAALDNPPVDELCARLDNLIQSVVSEVESRRRQVLQLQQATGQGAAAEGEGVRGAVMASAYTLLSAVESLESQLTAVRGIVTEQQRLLDSLKAESRTDSLTGLTNRRAFDEDMRRMIAFSRRGGDPLSLVMLDIDKFKRINDTYGHAAGDKVLRGVANVLVNTMREMDVVARYGGEEFAVILPRAALIDASRIAERIRTAVGMSLIQYNEHEIQLSISLGAAELCGGESTDALVCRADEALYAAKVNGRNRVYIHSENACQPIQQDISGDQGAQRRRWMRFIMNEQEVRLRHQADPWQPARVRDESVGGIGLETAPLSVERDDVVHIDYGGERREAIVRNVELVGENRMQLGLQWKTE